ncbi:MAG: hypothetical protein L0229_16300 [Blastocatellia bacterium]|nr:hypothetical protein [Blastocatellia bacterium]
MIKSGCSAMVVFLVLVLIIGSTPHSVRAADGPNDEERPIRLYATARTAPLGVISSFGSLLINGRQAAGQRTIWGGELLQAPAGKTVHISFDSIGRVTLARGAMARFAASDEASGDIGVATLIGAATLQRRRVLIASVIDGDLNLELEPEAGAYIRACGSAFTAAPGSRFHLKVSEGRATIDTEVGEVSLEQQPAQRTYVLRPVGIGANISVRTRATRQIQIQVTDENDRPVPDLPIVFALGGQGLGSLGSGATTGATITVNTNAQGIASAAFTAGDTAGSTTVTATVEGTRFSWTGNISVEKAKGFWTTQNTLIVAGIAAGAGVAIGIAATNDEERDPIVAIPPPVVRP